MQTRQSGAPMSRRKATKVDRQFIKSSLKLFEVFELYASLGREEEVSLNQVLSELDYPKTTVHRLIYSLEMLGYLERSDETGAYRLGPRFFQLVEGKSSCHRLKMVARPVMEGLARQVQETINLGILDGDEILLLDVVDGASAFRWVSHPGERSLVHSTALGKAIAAFLPGAEVDRLLKMRGLARLTSKTITKRGSFLRELRCIHRDFIAYDDEETVAGAQCIAAPIFGRNTAVVGALSVSGPKIRMMNHMSKSKFKVREAALKISRLLGYPIENKSVA